MYIYSQVCIHVGIVHHRLITDCVHALPYGYWLVEIQKKTTVDVALLSPSRWSAICTVSVWLKWSTVRVRPVDIVLPERRISSCKNLKVNHGCLTLGLSSSCCLRTCTSYIGPQHVRSCTLLRTVTDCTFQVQAAKVICGYGIACMRHSQNFYILLVI